MNWCSTEGIRLLHAAFPHGYLPAKGHTTLEGYVCVYASGDSQAKYIDSSRVLRGGFNLNDPTHARWFLNDRPDALLPDPDPADVATWSVLKAELARLSMFSSAAISVGHELDTTRGLVWSRARHLWKLVDWQDTAYWYGGIETSDPAEALIRAIANTHKTRLETKP